MFADIDYLLTALYVLADEILPRLAACKASPADHRCRAGLFGRRADPAPHPERAAVSALCDVPAVAPVPVFAQAASLQQADARAVAADRAAAQRDRVPLAVVVRQLSACCTPPPCRARPSRETVKRSEFAGYAAYRSCASHSRYFCGFPLYLLCASDAMPIAFEGLPRFAAQESGFSPMCGVGPGRSVGPPNPGVLAHAFTLAFLLAGLALASTRGGPAAAYQDLSSRDAAHSRQDLRSPAPATRRSRRQRPALARHPRRGALAAGPALARRPRRGAPTPSPSPAPSADGDVPWALVGGGLGALLLGVAAARRRRAGCAARAQRCVYQRPRTRSR